ncbi:hypothetical protein D030_1788B, partial [Vibrio parahaemolyticus AQ3810]
ERTTY